MMNVLALGLVLSSLAAAGVWSPARTEKPVSTSGFVKEGHRLLVVEYERLATVPAAVATEAAAAQDRSAASLYKAALTLEEDIIQEAKEKLREAAEVLPRLGQGISTPQVTGDVAEKPAVPSPSPPAAGRHVKEKICDAYGVCRDKVTGMFGKPVEKAEEAVAGVKRGVEDAAAGVRHGVEDAAAEVTDKTRKVKEGAEEATRKAARGVKEGVEDAAVRVKEGVKGVIHGAAEKAREAKEGTESAVRGAAEKAKHVKDEAQEAVAEKARGVKDTAEQAKEAVKGNATTMAKDAAEKAKAAGEEAGHNLADILTRARGVLRDSASYLASSLSWGASHTLAPAAHLLAFATAYGTCVWVTFVSSHVLAGALPRQQFGVVQSRLYPAYFRTMASSIGAALLAYYFSAAARQWKAESGHVYNLLGALGMVLGNMLVLEPRATKVMFESMRVEKEEGRGIAGSAADISTGTTPAATVVTATSTDVGTHESVPTTRTTHVETTSTAAPATASGVGKVTGDAAGHRKVGKLHKKLKSLNSYSSLLNILTLMSLTWHLVHLSRRLLPQEEVRRPC